MIRAGFAVTVLLCFSLESGTVFAQQQKDPEPFEPVSGQAGKDVVWVPTPQVLVEKMLDMARVTPQDFVMDLGSGDGRNIIAAAKRGARALGVEYNPKMVELSRRVAAKEGVADRAQFVEGDMFAADISKATVLALFLLPGNLDKLVDKFLALRPGTRIVANTFWVNGWTADRTETIGGECSVWCTANLYIVPARVSGRWQMPQGQLALEQKYQMITGTLTAGGARTPVEGRLDGERISFSAGGVRFEGRVNGAIIEGSTGAGGAWKAARLPN